MARPDGVVKLRHRKLKHLEVHLYEDQETKEVTTTVVDWGRGKVTTFQENKASPEPKIQE